jgi:hypothetical protein
MESEQGGDPMRKISFLTAATTRAMASPKKHQSVLGSVLSNFVKAMTKSLLWGTAAQGRLRLIAEIDKKGRIAQAEVAPKVSYLQHCNRQRCSRFESEQHRQAAKVASYGN